MSQKSKTKHGPSGASGAPSQVHAGSGSHGGFGAAALRSGADIEPQADSAAVPVWLFVAMIALLYWAMLHLDRYGGGFNESVFGPYRSYRELADLQPKSGPEMLIAKGEAVYGLVCIACHQATGLGAPGQYPPLVGSEWVQGPANRLIRIPIHGLSGVVQVKGQDWNFSMPAFGGAPPLDNDENLAAVLSYVRQAWGNKAPPISPDQVKAVRAETAARSLQWTADELLKVSDTP